MKKASGFIYFLYIASIIFFVVGATGCFLTSEYHKNPQTGQYEKNSYSSPIRLRPFGYKKLRKRSIKLPGPLLMAMREYRLEKNTFPANIDVFKYSSSKALMAMNGLDAGGFTDLFIDFWSQDSCSLSWEHPYVYNKKSTPGNKNIQASGYFIFTFKDSLFLTNIVFRKELLEL